MEFKLEKNTLTYMYRYLLKYVGTYRVKAEYDLDTEDYPRNTDGGIDESFEDLYIPCTKGVIKHTYLGNDILACCFYDKLQMGKNVYAKIKTKYPKLDILFEEDTIDAYIYFYAKDIRKIASVVNPKTSGARIDPFSIKNLPKLKYKIPAKDLTELYDITQDLSRVDTLHFFKETNQEFLQKLTKQERDEFKASRLGSREFIHYKGMWEAYLKFVSKRCKKYIEKNA